MKKIVLSYSVHHSTTDTILTYQSTYIEVVDWGFVIGQFYQFTIFGLVRQGKFDIIHIFIVTNGQARTRSYFRRISSSKMQQNLISKIENFSFCHCELESVMTEVVGIR